MVDMRVYPTVPEMVHMNVYHIVPKIVDYASLHYYVRDSRYTCYTGVSGILDIRAKLLCLGCMSTLLCWNGRDMRVYTTISGMVDMRIYTTLLEW